MKNPITYLIADDDPIFRELTLQYLKLIPGLNCIAECGSAIEAGQQLHTIFPDLLILDIEMPGLSGLQFAKSLTKLPLIIFITSHPHYAADAFEIDAIDYLVKPVLPERLFKAIEKARELIKMKNTINLKDGFKPVYGADDNSFFIKDKNSFIKINYKDVVYIESLGDFVNIFLQNGDKKLALVSLKNLELQLPSSHFIRISRTYMVNREKITAIGNTTVQLDKIQLTIGKTYTDTVLPSVVGNMAVKRFVN